MEIAIQNFTQEPESERKRLQAAWLGDAHFKCWR